MTTVTRTFDRPIIEVFDALADPWTYPEWLVGAKEMRSVEPEWPAPGASFHHRVGLGGPLVLDDRSTSCRVEAPGLLELEVRARPFGRARVTFRLTRLAPTSTEVEFSEVPIGAARVMAPVAAPLAVVRNRRSLDQLDRFLTGSGT
jgi:uncharacterized protein YndB with AHSA1/START domain